MVELRPKVVDYNAMLRELNTPQYFFKMCNRCRGDLYLDKDSSGNPFFTCLQCGNLIESGIHEDDGRHASRAYHQRRLRTAL